MDYEAQKILESVGAGPDTLLALLIVEMRKANQLAQNQQEILQELLTEMRRTQNLMVLIRQQMGY
jgi:hypothetical protein